MDNVFIGRLWRSIKYECLFLHDWAFGPQVREGFGKWFGLYNKHRPHQAMGYQTPDEAYKELANTINDELGQVA